MGCRKLGPVTARLLLSLCSLCASCKMRAHSRCVCGALTNTWCYQQPGRPHVSSSSVSSARRLFLGPPKKPARATPHTARHDTHSPRRRATHRAPRCCSVRPVFAQCVHHRVHPFPLRTSLARLTYPTQERRRTTAVSPHPMRVQGRQVCRQCRQSSMPPTTGTIKPIVSAIASTIASTIASKMDGLDTRACARPRRQLRPRQHAADAGSLRQSSRGGGVHRRRRGRRGRRRRRGPRRLRLAGPALLRPGTEGQQRHAASRTCVVQSRVRPHAEDEARPPLPRLLRPRLKIPPSAEGEVTWPEPAARTTRHRMRMRFCLAPGFAWRVNRSCVGLAMHAASAVSAQLSVLNRQCSTVSA